MKSKKIILCICLIIIFAGVGVFVKYLHPQTETKSADQTAPPVSAEAETTEPADDTDTIEGVIDPEKTVSDVTMVFSGDVMPSQSVLDNYDSEGISGIIDDTLLTEMKNADLCMVNEEFPYGTGGEQAPDKQYTFKLDPSYTSILTDLGVDIVSLANNHTLDFGKSVLSQTFETLDGASIPYVGAGETLERASAWETFRLGGRTIGVLAASRVIPVVEWDVRNQQPGIFTTYDPELLNAQIAAAEEKCDFVVVYVHWGVERQEKPEEYQRELAQGYIDAGADLVIGSHPHVLQGIEYYKGVPIVYSLGNYIFNRSAERTALIKAVWKADGSLNLQMIPAAASGAKTAASSGDTAKASLRHEEQISFDVQIDDDGRITQKEPDSDQ